MPHTTIKHVTVSRKFHKGIPGIHDKATEVSILSAQEKWSMNIACLETDEITPKELSQITISLPGGKMFTGTIQTLTWIEPVVKNALSFFERQTYLSEEDSDTMEELKLILSHFKNDTPHEANIHV